VRLADHLTGRIQDTRFETGSADINRQGQGAERPSRI
jgi:hypothetical protein